MQENGIVPGARWVLYQDADQAVTGEEISDYSKDYGMGIPAKVPSTVLANLVDGGVYTDVFIGGNLDTIDTEQFKIPWWYRTAFSLKHAEPGEHFHLEFDGINYRADIWLNKHKIASAETTAGSFRRFSFDVSGHVRQGSNVLAVKVYPPVPGEFTIGFVDWNPRPPDNNMGLFRPVRLKRTGPVMVHSTRVQTDVDLKTMDRAELFISTELANCTDTETLCTVQACIEGRCITQEVILGPRQEKTVMFDPSVYPELAVNNPRLWWPHTMGKPQRYTVSVTAETQGEESDREDVRIGIRHVSDYINDQGHRGYMINGQKVLIRGAGWVDDLFLREDEQNLRAQMEYVREMGLNCIRLEGFWGSSSTLYDLADEYGILLMAGWSCQWEWEGYLGKKVDEYMGFETQEEMDLAVQYLHDQVTWLRNHPSIFVWVLGSDKLPRPHLEQRLQAELQSIDPSRPVLASCAWLASSISGPTAVKMHGPYDWVPPNYWYEDTENGGAFGFNTETGPGPQPPPIESLQRMIPASSLWPPDSVWDFHCGRNEFNTMATYAAALENRYGRAGSAQEFAYLAQIASYEAIRGMFESFCINKHAATGVIQWMLNSAWPELYWQLYDWYLMPTGAYFGTRAACRPVALMYNYGNGGIYIHNDTLKDREGMTAHITLFSTASDTIMSMEQQVSAPANASAKIFSLPEYGKEYDVVFLHLVLKDREGRTVAGNFYWLANPMDDLNFESSLWYVTPVRAYADFTTLRNLPEAGISHTLTLTETGNRKKGRVEITNTGDCIAFGVELKLVCGENGNPVLPVFWEDNYISLLPGETRTLEVSYPAESAGKKQPVVVCAGMNIT